RSVCTSDIRIPTLSANLCPLFSVFTRMSRTGGATSSKPVQSRGDVIRETYSRRRRRHRSAGRRVGARRAAGGLVGANHSGGVAVARRPWCVSKEHHEEFVNTPPDADSSTALALERTRLAHERTLMAWVRTATSLISFGFTIYKFFQFLREQGETPHTEHRFGARGFALVMISVGLVSLLLATLGHWQYMKALRVL